MYIIVYNMAEFFSLKFNSQFEAKKILKAKGDQKHLQWSFHVIYMYSKIVGCAVTLDTSFVQFTMYVSLME